jgi:hypothetical protein
LQRRSFFGYYFSFESMLTPSEEGTDVDYLTQICTEDTYLFFFIVPFVSWVMVMYREIRTIFNEFVLQTYMKNYNTKSHICLAYTNL